MTVKTFKKRLSKESYLVYITETITVISLNTYRSWEYFVIVKNNLGWPARVGGATIIKPPVAEVRNCQITRSFSRAFGSDDR